MRLDKYLAHATGASRKQVKQWVKAGRVTLGGAVQRDAGMLVDLAAAGAAAKVCVDGTAVRPSGPRYLMLHKPPGTVCTALGADERSVLALLPAAERRELHPVGRLDLDTTGLLLLSDDGQWSHRITAPRARCPKVYLVTLADPLSSADERQLLDGVELHGETSALRALALSRCADGRVELTIGEGRYHQVKRMFAAVGNHVEALHRTCIGALALDPALAPGQWRALHEGEVALF